MVQMLGAAPLIRTWIQGPGNPPGEGLVEVFFFTFLGAVWHPEGLLITVHTEDAPWGYGFPKRDIETGELLPLDDTRVTREEDECMNQVLFNKFENNKYLDRPQFVKGLESVFETLPDNPCLRDRVDDPVPAIGLGFYRYWPFGYEPSISPDFDRSYWDDNQVEWVDQPGLNVLFDSKLPFRPQEVIGTRPLMRQYEGIWSLIYEEPTNEWFCHWPEEILYENIIYETIFQETNRLRLAVGEWPVCRPIRGIASGAWHTTHEMQRANIMFHDNKELYRPGYGMLGNRMRAMRTNGYRLGENLLVGGFYQLNNELEGEVIVDAWRHSPPHYANMIAADWSEPQGGTFLDASGGWPMALSETGEPYPNVYDPPPAGAAYGQWFVKHPRGVPWLWSGLISNDTQYGRVSIRSLSSHVSFTYSIGQASVVIFGGRLFFIRQVIDSYEPDSKEHLFIFGATTYTHEDETPWLRALVFVKGEDSSSFRSYVCPVAGADEEDIWVEECNSSAEDLFGTTRPALLKNAALFELTGTKAVFEIAVLQEDKAPFWLPVDDQEPDRVRFASSVVVFENGEFSVLREIEAPKLIFSNKTHTEMRDDKEWTICDEYKQEAKGTLDICPFMTADGDIQYLKMHVDLLIKQQRDGDDVYTIYDELEFPSGKRISVVDQHLVNGNTEGGCSLTVFLYINAETEDAVYVRANLRRAANLVFAQLDFYVNGELVKSFDEQQVANHYFPEDPKLYGEWITDEVDFNTVLDHVVDIEYFRSRNNEAKLFLLPYIHTNNDRIFCTNLPDVFYKEEKPLDGSWYIGTGPRHGSGSLCFSSREPRYFNWGYEAGIPIAAFETDGIDYASDVVSCECARYGERLVVDIDFRQLLGVKKDPPERILYANFDIDGEVGVGKLTQYAPLGVV
jgi:hypothetical protein